MVEVEGLFVGVEDLAVAGLLCAGIEGLDDVGVEDLAGVDDLGG